MKRFFILTFSILTIFGCKGPTSGLGTLEGFVYQKDNSDRALPNVAVIYGDSAIYTNSDGFFRYDTIPEGLQGITFRKDGYFDYIARLNISRDIVNTTTIELELDICGWAVGGVDSYFGTILRTTNGGQNWVRQGAPSMIPEVDLLDVCTINDKECFVVGEPDLTHRKPTILYTSDGGNEWKNVATQSIPAVSYGAVITKDGKNIWCASSDSSIIVRSSDGGKSWKTAINSENMKYYSALTTHNGNEIWACGLSVNGGAAVEYSSDGGNSWEFIPINGSSGIQKATDIYAERDGILILTGDTGLGLMESDDQGFTWKSISSLGSGNSLYTLSVHENMTIRTASEAGTLYTSTPEGVFNNVFPNNFDNSYKVTDISFLRDGFCGAAIFTDSDGLSSYILYTTDGGSNWNESTMPYHFPMRNIDFAGGNN